MRYKSSTEYWLNSDTMTLRGEFDEMYQDIEDPWGCLEKSNSIYKKLLVELIFNHRKYRNILDLGCGLGGFTKYLAEKNGPGSIAGCDVSSTAVQKARLFYPDIPFEVKNIMHDDLNSLKPPFDLIVISEVLWYVLDNIVEVFKKISNVLTPTGIIAIQQYFPDNQQFGNETINGTEGFELFIKNKTNFTMMEKVVCYVENDGVVLLTLLGKKNIPGDTA